LWAWALAPPLFLYVGHNWDLLAVLLALAAFIAAQRGQLVQGVALAAVGAAAKLFPVLLLPLLSLRHLYQRRLRIFAVMVGLALTLWLAINLPIAALAPDNWWEFYSFSTARDGTRAALWSLLQHYGLLQTPVGLRNQLSAAMLIAGIAAILALGWQRHRDQLWLLFTPVLLWFILSNKVYSPQFDLWAYPFILITARRWQPIALFVLGDVGSYFAEMWFFAGQEGGWPAMPMEAIALTAVIRAAAMLWLIADALRLPPPAWLLRGPLTSTT